jgi:hypothetical protein
VFTYKKKLQFIAMSRSGHHAVINWVLKQYTPLNHLYVNCVYPNPDRGEFNKQLPHAWGQTWWYEVGREAYRSDNTSRIAQLRGEPIPARLVRAGVKPKYKSTHDFNVYATSYENWEVQFCMDYENQFEDNVSIVILRDLRNWIASQYKLTKSCNLPQDKWKDQAENMDRGGPAITINYNEWFLNKSYRRYVCEHLLEVPFSDDGLNDILISGSSWHPEAKEWAQKGQHDWHGKAQEKLDVVNRWKEFKNDPEYWKIVNRLPGVVELNEKLFGKYYV